MRWIDRCLESVAQSNLPADIYVIDNGSTDGTIKHIRENYKNVALLESSENLGFGKANNLGLEYAVAKGYDYVYLLNQDAWVSPATIGTLVEINKRRPDFGILSPVQINASGALDRNFSYCCPREVLSDFFQEKLKDLYEVSEVMAAHWLISSDCLRKTGAFSPAFPHYGEDNNYVQRAALHGFKTGIVTGTKAVHDRENRPLTKAQIMYRQYIAAITDYSNPLISQSLLRISLWHFVKNAFTMKSMTPFRYLARFIAANSRLRRIRKESFREGAFLKIIPTCER